MSYNFPPRQMRAAAAAYYCGVSESTFLDRVRSGSYPAGELDGGARVWLRDDLDAMIDRRFGVVENGAANDRGRDAAADPFAARFSKAS
jgi:predicted DNA-binding transcriptional regulator AlpA